MYSPDGSWGAKESVKRRHEGLSPAALALATDVGRFRRSCHDPPSVLDIGCGVGHILDAFGHQGYSTYGIEPSTDVAFEVHRRLLEIPPGERYDVVILHHVLEHLAMPFEMLHTAAAAVHHGGVVVVGVPAVDSLPEHGNFRYVLNGTHHLCAFSLACLQRAFRRCGFGHFQVLDRGEASMRLRVLARRSAPTGPPTEDDLERPFEPFKSRGTTAGQS